MKIIKIISFKKISWQKISRQAANIIRHPKTHWLEIAIAALILIVILFLLFLIIKLLRKRSAEKKSEKKELIFTLSKPPTKITSRPFYLVMALLVAVIITLSISYISKPSFCGSCHQIKPSYASWKQSKHKKITCLKCHQKPGITGWANAPFRIMSNFSLRTTYYLRFRPIKAMPISNATCRSCHLNIKNRTVVSSIKVSHKGIDEGGFYCTNCHKKVGHKQSSLEHSQVLSKDYCLVCHNGKTAPDKCALCHVKDIGFKYVQLQDYTVVTIGQEVCGTCHTPINCLECHSKKELSAPKAPEKKLQPPTKPGK